MSDGFDAMTQSLAALAELRRAELLKLTAQARRIAADLTAALPEQYQAAGYRFEWVAPRGIPELDSAQRIHRAELGQREERRGDLEGEWR